MDRKRLPTFCFALLTYLAAVKTLLYLVGFLSNRFVSRGIDDGAVVSTPLAVAIDLALLLSFFVVHSLMARSWCKEQLARLVSPTAERSVYLLVSCVQLWLIFLLWKPLPGAVWQLRAPEWAGLVWAVAILGWLTSLLAIRNLDHLRLFGLRTAWQELRGQERDEETLVQRRIHGVVRNPMYLGFLVGIWATPEMSRGHVLFAVACSAYILLGVRMEERSLLRRYGAEYQLYRERVGRFLPRRPLFKPAASEGRRSTLPKEAAKETD